MFLAVDEMAFFKVCMATSVVILRLKEKTLLLVNMIVNFFYEILRNPNREICKYIPVWREETKILLLQRILRNTYCQEFIAYCIMGMTLDISKPLRILCLHSPRITS
jgi:hypothetical protein